VELRPSEELSHVELRPSEELSHVELRPREELNHVELQPSEELNHVELRPSEELNQVESVAPVELSREPTVVGEAVTNWVGQAAGAISVDDSSLFTAVPTNIRKIILHFNNSDDVTLIGFIFCNFAFLDPYLIYLMSEL
jgi:hypothetical protein